MKNVSILLKKVTAAGLFFILAFSSPLHAQESTGGIKGGLNLSSLDIDDVDDSNIIPGFHLGVWGKLMVTDRFGLQPEILYSTKGVKAVYDSEFLGFDIADGETKLNINYIDIPVYLSFNLSDDFDFHIGPYLSFLMNAKVKTDAKVLEFIDVDNEDEIDRSNFNTIDYGFSGGLGFNFEPLTFGFNYNLGLRQVSKDGESMENLLGDAKNNTVQIYVGFMF